MEKEELLSDKGLSRCGFEKSIHGEWYHEDLIGWITKFGNEKGSYCYNVGRYKVVEIKFIHELKFLFRGLAKKELEEKA